MTTLISSQRYRHDDIVEEKRAARDYVVTVVTIDGLGSVIIDGHHSLSAAIEDGVEPTLVECLDKDVLYGLDDDLDAWLLRHWIDSDYHNAITGELIF